MRGTIFNLSALALGLLLSVGCKSQKPVGLTKIPTMTPIVKTVTVPGPAQPWRREPTPWWQSLMAATRQVEEPPLWRSRRIR